MRVQHMGGTAKPPHPFAARLAEPAVRRKIQEKIGKRFTASAREDLLQQVFLRLLLVPAADFPASSDGLLGLAASMTWRVVVDHVRGDKRRQRRGEGNEDISELEAQLAAEPVPGVDPGLLAKVHEFVEREIARGKIPREYTLCTAMLADGKSYEEIARAIGRSVSWVKVTVYRSRKHLRLEWPKYAGTVGAGLVVLLVVLLVRHRPQPDIEALPEGEQISPIPSASIERPAASAERTQQIAELLDQAKAACANQDYDLCEQDLGAARAIDPKLEKDYDLARQLRELVDYVRAHPEIFRRDPTKLEKKK